MDGDVLAPEDAANADVAGVHESLEKDDVVSGENVVKGDQVLADGRRIILFTTKEHLKILARARQILGDGTFRITPGLWCQTFIISAEVSSGVFVPVAFCLLPDKIRY